MPTTRGSYAKVMRTNVGLRDYVIRKEPNAVIFNPHRNKTVLPNPPDQPRVHFNSAHTLKIKHCEGDKPRKSNSVRIISCAGKYDDMPEKEIQPKPRPQSAITYREKRPRSAKPRPQSASTYKSTSDTSEGTSDVPDVAEIIADIKKIVIDKRRWTRRVWKPKKTEQGIHQPAPPPPPTRHYPADAQMKKPDTKPTFNNLGHFQFYKYSTSFHKYGHRNNKVAQSTETSREIPNCLKHPHRYHFAAARQSCRYKPFASVTSVSHHHKVNSNQLPHPLRGAETPPPSSPRTNIHLELQQALEEVELDEESGDDEADGGEEEEDEERVKNGTFSFVYDESTSKNITTITETDGDMTDTARSDDGDLYFLSKNMPKANNNDNAGNNNKLNTSMTLSDIDEMRAPETHKQSTSTVNTEDIYEVEEVIEKDSIRQRKTPTPISAHEIESEDDELQWNDCPSPRSTKEAKSLGFSKGKDEDSSMQWNVERKVEAKTEYSLNWESADRKERRSSNASVHGKEEHVQSRKSSVSSVKDARPPSRALSNRSDGKGSVKSDGRGSVNSAGIEGRNSEGKTSARSASREGSAKDTGTKAFTDSSDPDISSDDNDDSNDDNYSIGSDILDELDKLEQRKSTTIGSSHDN